MPVSYRGHLGGVCFCALQTGQRPSTPSPVPVPCRGHLWGVCFCALQTGLRPSTLFSFSFLDERKGGKRKSRRQGRQPNLPGTGCVYVVYPAIFPSPGRGRQGRQPNLPGTGCVYVMYQAHLPSPGRGRQGRQPNLPGTGRGCQGHRPNQSHPPHLPWPRQRP